MTINANSLPDIIAQGSMRATAKLLADKKVRVLSSIEADELMNELKSQIKNGYDQAVADAKEALDTMNFPMAKATLNASCILFAINALKNVGLLEAAS